MVVRRFCAEAAAIGAAPPFLTLFLLRDATTVAADATAAAEHGRAN
jgi:hypothetical protein